MKAFVRNQAEEIVRKALAVLGGRAAKAQGLVKGSPEYTMFIRDYVDTIMAEGFDDEDVAEARRIIAECQSK